MKPYFETELGALYYGDCLELVPHIGPVDMVVTSPPYNLGNNHHTSNFRHTPYDDDKPEYLYQAQQAMLLASLFLILSDGGWCFYNHKHRIKKGKLIKPDEWISFSPFVLKQEIVWNNGSPNMDKRRFFPFTERIYCLSKTQKNEIFNSLCLTDDWHICGNGARNKDHTRGFPLEVPVNLINSVNCEGYILDPYMGSGTTAVACEKLNRRWIGIEISERYCEIAVQRIKKERQQLKLFKPEAPKPKQAELF